MKKTNFIFMLLCIVMFPFSVIADEIYTETWDDDIRPMVEALGLEGDFYSLEDLGLAVWLPDGMIAVEVPEEDADAGRLYLIMDDDCYLAVDTIKIEGMTWNRLITLQLPTVWTKLKKK